MWATVADVQSLTGVAVEPDALTQAEGVVELFAGITVDNTTELSGRNARMLRAAVAYQAAWMASQVDVTARTDISSIDQDGVRVTPAHADALVLAPLAKRALDRLSWRGGPRTIRLRREGPARFATFEEYAAAWMRDDELGTWTPMGYGEGGYGSTPYGGVA